ncbi:hypothetical protein BDV09DRAFT_187708 [Aspergillus tetrazonus]
MAPWESLICFQATDQQVYWALLALEQTPATGLTLRGFPSIEALEVDKQSTDVLLSIVTGPAPRSSPSNQDQYYLYWPQLLQPCQQGISKIQKICFYVASLTSPLAQLAIPQCLLIWYKAPPALANLDSNITFPVQAQNAFRDFEGKLTIVLCNTIKSLPAASSTSQILSYTISNNLTACMFQRACSGYRITMRVNGRVVQDSPFDFIFLVDELLAFLLEGTMIPAGTAIMNAGGPDGNVVEVEVKPIGVLRNKIVFEK